MLEDIINKKRKIFFELDSKYKRAYSELKMANSTYNNIKDIYNSFKDKRKIKTYKYNSLTSYIYFNISTAESIEIEFKFRLLKLPKEVEEFINKKIYTIKELPKLLKNLKIVKKEAQKNYLKTLNDLKSFNKERKEITLNVSKLDLEMLLKYLKQNNIIYHQK